MDKKDNLPLDNAAERHGHSVKFFVEVYGRLSVEDTLDRFRLHYGLQAPVQQLERPIQIVTPPTDTLQALPTTPPQRSSTPTDNRIYLR